MLRGGKRDRLSSMRSRFRLLDAAFNRGREALRVLEDVARFILEDREGTARLKGLRHALDGLSRPYRRELLAARDVGGDVGRERDYPAAGRRFPQGVVAANFKRAEEALRSIEETARGAFPELARGVRQVRYALYELEKRFGDPQIRLRAARLYVLLDPAVARGSLERVAREVLRGGADIVQLRQKPRVDVGLARALRAVVGEKALFIVNDRPDVALAAEADGVHLGAADFPVEEARRLGIPLVGATTHSLAEARRAVAAGADYISVGPVFATGLKPGLPPRGFSYLAAARRLGVPVFCIGGITRRNVRPGMGRVAVCSGVIGQRDPAAAARAIRKVLTAGG